MDLLDQLQEEIDGKIAEALQRVEKLKEIKENLAKDVADMQEAFEGPSGTTKTQRQLPGTTSGRSRGRAAKGKVSTRDAVLQALEDGPMGLGDLAKEVKKLGVKSDAADFSNIVYQRCYKMRKKGELAFDEQKKLYHLP